MTNIYKFIRYMIDLVENFIQARFSSREKESFVILVSLFDNNSKKPIKMKVGPCGPISSHIFQLSEGLLLIEKKTLKNISINFVRTDTNSCSEQ